MLNVIYTVFTFCGSCKAWGRRLSLSTLPGAGKLFPHCGPLYLPRSTVTYLKPSTNILHVPLTWGGFANQISNTTALLSVYTILIIKASTKTRAARHRLEISVVFPNDGQPAWTKCFCCVQCRTECMSLVKFIVDWIHFSVLCGRTMSIPCQTEIFLRKVYTRFCSVARNVSSLHSTYVSPILLALGYIWLKNTAMT